MGENMVEGYEAVVVQFLATRKGWRKNEMGSNDYRMNEYFCDRISSCSPLFNLSPWSSVTQVQNRSSFLVNPLHILSKTLLVVGALILEMCPSQLTTKVSVYLSDTQTIYLNTSLPPNDPCWSHNSKINSYYLKEFPYSFLLNTDDNQRDDGDGGSGGDDNVVCVCICHGTDVKVMGKLCEICCLLHICGFQVLNSDDKLTWQVSLLIDPSYEP